MKLYPVLICLIVSAFTNNSFGEDWKQFRGPGGLGTSSETGLPVKWSSTENVVWKSELPGYGSSSPTTLGDRIYLTCYNGYGLKPSEGDDENLKRFVVCLDRGKGSIIWKQEFQPELPESDYNGGNNARHGYSTSTIATDGTHLFVFFGKSGVYCLDLDGKTIWQTKVGSGTRGWGSGASPVLYKDLLIVNASVESQTIYALDKSNGKEVWSIGRIRGVWNTPLLVENPAGKMELVYCLPEKIVAVDPDSGDELWTCEGIPDRGYICPSAVANDGIVYVIGGRKNTAIAVRSGGSGDVSETHVLWRTGRGSNVSSPVYYEGHIYWFHERRGVVYCLNAENGEVVFEERLSISPGLVYASTTVVDGKLYCVSQYNGAFVVAAKPEFEELAHNQFEDDASRTNASPVVSNGQLLLRSDQYLYCIGEN